MMRRPTTLFLLALIIMISMACQEETSPEPSLQAVAAGEVDSGGEQTEQDAAADLPPVQLAIEIAKRVEADPGQAVQILQEYDLTEAEFDQLLYDIATDPELRQIYNEAMNR